MRAFLAALGTIITLSVLPIVAQAEDVDQLIRTMDELSHQTNDKNEAVKHKEDEVKAAEDEVNRLTGVAQDTEAVARTAEESEKAFQAEVNRIAGAKYRGVAIDPMSKIFGAHNPQIAIDQTAYMATITAQTEEAVAKLVDATKVAKDARDAAAKAVEDAKQHKANLEGERDNLTREQEELKGKMKELMDKVNGLSPADRAKWVAKNGPIDYSIAGLVGANPIGMKALEIGMTKIGAPYGWGATGPDVFDCSGLVLWSYAQQGITVPRTSQAQMAGGTPVSREELQPGDVVGFYPGATHVGIYAGDNKILHASDYGIPVQVVSMDSMPYYGARRY
ncbi:MAG: NlpC/P60 family protein [Corynebacterium matruchotii]